MPTVTQLNGALRLYDGTATPYFVNFLFEGEMSFPHGPARPEETVIFHRGRHSDNTHYVLGSDEPILEPLDISFSFRLQSEVSPHNLLRDALCNPEHASPWLVGGDAWVTTKGSGLLVPGCGGAAVADPDFVDPLKVTVNMELLYEICGSGDIHGRRFRCVYISPDNIAYSEADDGVTVSVTGRCYGGTAAITAFTAGTESTAP